MVPFFYLSFLACLYFGLESFQGLRVSAALSASASASTVVRLQGRHVFDLLPLVDVYVVQATGALR